MRPIFLIGASVLAVAASGQANAQGPAPEDEQDLSSLSIEELAQIEVRSASKVEEPLSAAPTALYVITNREIVNSGVTSLPEAVRLAPNLQVQRVDASQYAISARGFNGLEAGNKLLVLIDGRSIYTPLASTVFWNLHSPVLEDIQQIEVISGPGGTLYGPNAVNGVVNVTTRSAQDTIGTMARGTAGSLERTAAIRHGFSLGGSGAIRLYADWHDNHGFQAAPGRPEVNDAYRGWQAGFRSDFGQDDNHLTVQGDIFRTDADTLPGDGAHGQNVLARWTRALSPSSSFEVQAYYDYFKREFTLVEDSVETLDAQAQFNVTGKRNRLVAGVGVRTTRDRFINDLNAFKLVPDSRRLWVYNLFAQDTFSVTPTLDIIGGIKAERSTFVGWQLLPNFRIAWRPDSSNLVWAAVSRAVRTPNRIDRQLTAVGILAPSVNFESEKLIAIEAGYRVQPSKATTFSVSGFLNFYDDIRTTETTNGGLPFQLLNGWKGTTYGFEAWGAAQLTPAWRMWLGASTLWKDFQLKDGHIDLVPFNSLGSDPNWQVTLRSEFDLTPRLRLNLSGRAVGDIDQAPQLGSYVELGGDLSYQLNDRLELYLAAYNLLHERHQESNNASAQLPSRSISIGTRVNF
jgi:iron complex outermembrane receptor protein